ncbi:MULTISPECIES: FGGY-family carbohydrate kinase [unclassified Treponema]|uniref:FGGY-family carbohydrate kinase n=1 Tax=unclassified Treponema TaxID=2638727 RepID=UPI0020A5FAFA|nr:MULTISPECIES: FGGY-family carbohydrate kinase [unclassified Treponema]UTC66443.1 sugar kinase [Treponema sp. OMZ 789]UTC69174.1 sugar kinase [Treponema sp. OMZ 790]UTC71887.1 sugar kinase [Treponema sp. OMZ 791]
MRQCLKNNFCAAVFDIGTSSLKGALIAEDGKVHTQGRLFFPQNLEAETWLVSFENLFKQFSDFAEIKGIKICGICISGNGPSLVAVSDKSGSRDFLLLWNKASPEASDGNAKEKNLLYGKSIFLPRLDLFRNSYPEIFDNAKYILSGPEYLIYKLTKNAVTVLPEKRYVSAYWSDEELKALSIPKKKIPPFVPLGEHCGLYRNIPVFAGPPDFIAALIGTNTLKPGRACDRAGSSEGINICIEAPPESSKLKGLRLLPSLISDLWNLSYIIEDSGSLFYEYIKKHGGSFMDFDAFVHSINTIESYKENEAEGRAIIEALAFKVKEGMDLLEKAAGFRPVYTLSGGQANNKLWRELKAEITGREFKVLQIADAELLGNAAIVFTSLKTYASISEAADGIASF